MKIYIGGAHQGQAELAAHENPGADLIRDFHIMVRQWLETGKDPGKCAEDLMAAKGNAVVVSDELGSGIVPMAPFDRAWREAHGRTMCRLSQFSESVTRVTCGIGVRIK